MALNPDRVGHAYPAYTYEVSREKVREYALATGVADPVYHDGFGGPGSDQVVAPPTFAACFTLGQTGALLQADPDLGAHQNLVHTSQEYEFHRPLRVGDVLTCTPRIADIRSRGRMELLTVHVDCADRRTDEPVLTSRTTLIFFASEDR